MMTDAMTLEKLLEAAQKLRDIMPKQATFLVSRHYPPDQNIKVEGKDEIFVLLYPATLERVLAETRKATVPNDANRYTTFGGIPIFEMDSHENDTPDAGIARMKMAHRLSVALNQAVAIYAERKLREDMRRGDYKNMPLPIRHGSLINTDIT